MQQAVAEKTYLVLESTVPSAIAASRFGIGLVQGVVLYLLYHAAKSGTWPANAPMLFAPLLLVWLLAPVLLVSALGHLRKNAVIAWSAVAVLTMAGLALHDVWRGSEVASPEDWRAPLPSALLFIFASAGFYIAHSLVLAGAQDGRRVARYPTYFETAWKLAIQVLFSVLFVGALWLVLQLGAALFNLVSLDFLKRLLGEPWFAIPVTTFAFSCALHITDVRPAIVRGIRTLLLVLLSWILPVATLIVGGFLFSLPWTGLEPLWATRHATAVLLGAAAVLVLLVNAAFQNGEGGTGVARAVRISARSAALLLVPALAIAVYSLGLRVVEYGWTTDRIVAAACLLVASCYGVGYAWAALRKGPWMAGLAPVNIGTAFVVLAVLLSLFTPLADPARLSVASQLARLAAGKVDVEAFDFDYLRFEGKRYGRAALERLAAQASGLKAARTMEKAQLALDKKSRWPTTRDVAPSAIASNLHVWPESTVLPDSFLKEKWASHDNPWTLPRCLLQRGAACDVYSLDLTGDGKAELLLIGAEPRTGAAVMMEGDNGWTLAGQLPYQLAGCAPLREQLRKGNLRPVAPRLNDLEVAGQRLGLVESSRPAPAVCQR